MHADRKLVKKWTHKHLQLEGRDPALITLPIPIPSIPIIEPILTKLIAGEPLSDIKFPTLAPNHPPTTCACMILIMCLQLLKTDMFTSYYQRTVCNDYVHVHTNDGPLTEQPASSIAVPISVPSPRPARL